MKVDLVILDAAGTTVADPGCVLSCFQKALEHLGVTATAQAINAVMGLPKPEALRRLLGEQGESERVRPGHEVFQKSMREFYAQDPRVAEVPGAAATMRWLRKHGCRVALNTGFDRSIFDVLLQRLGWRQGDVFDASIASDESPRGRPHPDMILAMMQQLGVPDPHRVAKVGDTPTDLQEGEAAGCGFVIGVTSGAHTHEELERHPHTHILASVAELASVLG